MKQAEPWEGRRVIGWTVVVALCVAALVAIQSIVTGSFDSADARVVGLSLGFGTFTATGGAGAALTSRLPQRLPTLGQVTVVMSVISFLLLAAALWLDPDGDTWRW